MFKYIFSLASILCIAGHAQTAPSVGGSSISKPWETTVYFTGGPASYVLDFPPNFPSFKLRLYDAGFSVGKVFADRSKDWHVRGQFEYLAEIEPFWLSHSPPQPILIIPSNPLDSFELHFTASNSHGVAVTPMLFRYRFPAHSRLTPYIQLGGGLLYTFSEFPEGQSSIINFTPQADFGTHIATGKKQAIVLGVNVEHISNAGLGYLNPGITVTVAYRVGYTWWH